MCCWACPPAGFIPNGFSLVRKVLERSGLSLTDPAPFAPNRSMAEVLLDPTRIYVKSVLAALKTGGVHGLCHITGGGFYENLPRSCGDDLSCHMEEGTWLVPPIFDWLQQAGGISQEEMYRVFNCGIGMVLFADPAQEEAVRAALETAGEQVFRIGQVAERGDGPAVVVNPVGGAA